MMNAYSELYIEDAATNMGEYMDYMINVLHYEDDKAFEMFAYSETGRQFERGNPKYVTGMSGCEIAVQVIHNVYCRWQRIENEWNINRTAEYWMGWAIAQYQWKRGISFCQMIENGLTASCIKRQYILHEADISKFYEWADTLYSKHSSNNKYTLRRLRRYAQLTQKDLSEKSGVSLRMIQLYEQGQNDIRKAQAGVVLALAKTLGTSVENLLQ